MTIFVIRTLNVQDDDHATLYEDRIGHKYHYDSKVGNSKSMGVGDVILLRGNGELLGLSRISEVLMCDFMKDMLRCVACGSTEIYHRKRGNDYRCTLCKEEFPTPNITKSLCVSYTAKYERMWTPFSHPIPIKEGDLRLSGYRTNAIRKLQSLSDLTEIAKGYGQDITLLEFLSSSRLW